MHVRSASGIWLVLLLCSASEGAAQESRRTGLVATSGSTVGLLLHVSDRLAIRPEVSFSTTSVESGQSGNGIDTSAGSILVSAILTVRRWDDLSAYVSPRFTFTRSSGTSVSTIGSTSVSIETTNTAYGVGGFFGAQYRLAERFAVFGETGVLFTDTTTKSDPVGSFSNSQATSVGSRSGIGVVFYF